MSAAEVEAFLTPSTHNQAVSAILFLYREVLVVQLRCWITCSGPHIGIAFFRAGARGVSTVLGLMEGSAALLARLLYGTGLPPPDSMRTTADWVVPIFSATWAWVKP